MPSVLAIFWFNVHYIGLDACLTQMFFIHALSSVESGVLVAMAFDRLVAVCAPLNYTRLLTHSTVACLGGAAVIRAATLVAPLPFLLRTFPFCGANTLSHSYCYLPDMLNLACGDAIFSDVYGLVFVLFTFAVDVVFILASYMKILATVTKLENQDRNWKSLHTCACHLCTFSSVQLSRSVMSDCLQPHESQHARSPCPSQTPGVYSDSCPSSQ